MSPPQPLANAAAGDMVSLLNEGPPPLSRYGYSSAGQVSRPRVVYNEWDSAPYRQCPNLRERGNEVALANR